MGIISKLQKSPPKIENYFINTLQNTIYNIERKNVKTKEHNT